MMTEHESQQSTSVTITVDTVGTVRIGDALGGAPRSAPLSVFGGLLVVDPFAPDQPPHAELHTYEKDTEYWLPLVYGQAVADQVSSVLQTARSTPCRAGVAVTFPLVRNEAPWEPGELHVLLSRLAVARWLARWTPTPLDTALLTAETADLLAQCADAIPDAEDAASDMFEQSVDTLLALADHALECPAGNGAGARAAHRVRELIESAASLLRPDHPGAVDIRRWSRRMADRHRHEGDVEWQETLAERSSVHIHDDNGLPGWNTSTVDWSQVVAGAVDAGEEGVRWQVVDAGGELTIDVSVQAGWDREVEVWARVYAEGSPVPVAMSSLALVEPRDWRGRLSLPRRCVNKALSVDIFSPSTGHPPRTGNAGRIGRCERVAVRLLNGLRRAWAVRDLRALASIAQSLTDLAEQLASLTQSSDPMAVTLSRLARSTGGVSAKDVPDLRHPAWSLTLTEMLDQQTDLLGPWYRATY